MKQKNSVSRQDVLINRIITVFVLACVAAAVLMSLGRKTDIQRFTIAVNWMPWIAIGSAVAAVICFILERGFRKKEGDGYLHITYTPAFFGGLFVSLAVAAGLFYLLPTLGYYGQEITLLLLALCIAVILYVVKLAYKPEFFAYSVFSAIALVAMFFVRHVQGGKRFYFFLALALAVEIVLLVLAAIAKKNGGKLFGKRLFGKKMKLYPFVIAFAVSLAAFAVYAFIPASFLYCVIACVLQYFIVGISVTVLSK